MNMRIVSVQNKYMILKQIICVTAVSKESVEQDLVCRPDIGV